jgi:hypothetical protein
MPVTNIQSLNYGDSQSQSIDKINYNFDEIVEGHGGTQGITGPTGSDGPAGNRGPIGTQGATGVRGTRWFVDFTQPSGTYNAVVEGDFWIDSANGNIYTFTESGWDFTGYTLASGGNIFKDEDSYFTSGGTGSAILFDQILPQNYLFIIADKVPESGVLNENLSKFIISTDTTINDAPLLEFSKSNIESGLIGDYSQHPIFRWKNFQSDNNSLVLEIPGGSFIIGASGGFESTSDLINIKTPSSANISYGATSGSGIFSTGGFDLNSGGQFKIKSAFVNITGGSGYISAPVNLTANLTSTAPSIYSFNGGTAGFRTSRTSDTFNTLSHSTYSVSLETASDREFFIDTKGKIKTKKAETSLSYVSTTPGATSTVSANSVNWYLISRTGTTVNSSVLEGGNTVVVNPVVPSSGFVGIGIYNNPEFSWAGPTGGLDLGQSIDVNVHYSATSIQPGYSDGFRYIGRGATSGNVTNVVSLPFPATNVDFTLARGVTGGNMTVFYRAYGSAGGSGGSFTI